MSSNIYTAGLNNVGSYQVSGVPFCSGSIDVNSYGPAGIRIQFPYVTSWVQILNFTNNQVVYVAFSQNGLSTNHFRVQQFESGFGTPMSTPLSLKVTELWLSGACDEVDVLAGLTYIPTAQVTAVSPSGSNWSGSVGVG